MSARQSSATSAALTISQGNPAPTGGRSNLETEQAQTLSREKRRIRDLEDELEELRSNKVAKRSNSASVVNKGRAFRRVVSLFENPNDLIREYDRRAEIADEGLDDEDGRPFPHSPVQDRQYRGFQEFLEFFPWIKARLTGSEPAELEDVFKQLRKGSDGARGDDASALKKEAVNWLQVTDIYAPILPPISPSQKSDRGLDHDVTGRLLCPIEYDWDDPEVRKKIRERHPEFLVTEGSWPRFLYDTGYKYDPNNIEKGLFKSTLLLKAVKLIFTSPTSANEVSAGEHPETRNMYRRTRSSAEKNTRSHVASLIGMRSIKPRAIAYAAVQLRFALSSLTSWRMIDGDFDANVFYQHIVDYFEAPPGPGAKVQVQALLLWWDRKVFGYYRDILSRPPEAVANSSVARMVNQQTLAEVPSVPRRAAM